MPPVVNIGTVVGTYTTPALHVEVSGMLTNTHCTSPYRGAGRPEASYMIERLIDIAADQMDVDPAELRRRNTIPPQAMPYKTPLTFTYDSGRFEENLDRTMKLSRTGLALRRGARRRHAAACCAASVSPTPSSWPPILPTRLLKSASIRSAV
jgi:carbon-monoxide dehydrogenase large subunit